MYALRDVTSTVESIPLIVASILSKKVAEGAQGLVMDVKCGRGAFMPDEASALRLARELARVGGLLGVSTVSFVTDMDRPLGRAIGNANEIAESIALLKGGGPEDLKQITRVLGAAMLVLGGVATDFAAGERQIEAVIADGRGLERFRRLIEAQGGDPAVLDNPGLLPQPAVRRVLKSPAAGYLVDLDPRAVGEAVIELGGGRRRADDEVDHSVGILLLKSPGDAVGVDEPLLEVAARDEVAADRVIAEFLRPGIRIAPLRQEPPPLIRRVVTRGGKDLPFDPALVRL
jgi:thymidine phosphorylase